MRELDDHLQAVVQAGVPGVVAVAAGPGLSWEGAAGVADAETGAPLTTNHRFLIGSVTKTFVAAVVLQLVGEGVLALDEEVGPIAEGVTLRQLLNHTSGVPDYYADFDSLIEPYRKDRAYRPNLTPRAALELVHARPRLFPPGEGWAYSGGNYIVARADRRGDDGRDPARRAETKDRRAARPRGNRPPEGRLLTQRSRARRTSRRTTCFFQSPAQGLVDVTDVELFGWGAGEMVSTARDVARFLQALLGGELLTPRLRSELLTTVASDWEESDGYGLGIEEVSSLMGHGPNHHADRRGATSASRSGIRRSRLSSESGDRQIVVCANTLVMSDETWAALGDLTWTITAPASLISCELARMASYSRCSCRSLGTCSTSRCGSCGRRTWRTRLRLPTR